MKKMLFAIAPLFLCYSLLDNCSQAPRVVKPKKVPVQVDELKAKMDQIAKQKKQLNALLTQTVNTLKDAFSKYDGAVVDEITSIRKLLSEKDKEMGDMMFKEGEEAPKEAAAILANI